MERLVLVLFVILILGEIIIIKKMKKQVKFLTKRNEELRKEIYTLEVKKNELQYVLKSYEYFKQSLEIFRFEKAVDIVENKQGNLYLLMEHQYQDKLTFQLSGIRHPGLYCPLLLATINDKVIKIDDFYAREEDAGNGTLLLQALDKKAKEIGVEKIIGELSPVDKDHFDKLEYFYSKNGFKVTFTTDMSRGSIKKEIDMQK